VNWFVDQHEITKVGRLTSVFIEKTKDVVLNVNNIALVTDAVLLVLEICVRIFFDAKRRAPTCSELIAAC